MSRPPGATPTRDGGPPVPLLRDVGVTAYRQYAGSSGWCILALIRVDVRDAGGARPGGVVRQRWGVLDILAVTALGASISVDDMAESRSAAEVVVDHWELVDWHADQAAASAAHDEAWSRSLE